jgi:hypothetical protein
MKLHYANCRTTLRVLLVICLASLTACQSIATTNNATAKRFLEHIYSDYQAGGTGVRAYEDGGPELFAPELLALIREDMRREDQTGDLRMLNFDPFCDCQDWEAIDVREINVAATAENTAAATVTFRNFTYEKRLRFKLRAYSGGWRIEDIESSSDSVGSLYRFLSEGLANP